MSDPVAGTAKAAEPPFSLLRLSAAQRLAGAAVVIAAIWLGVAWVFTSAIG